MRTPFFGMLIASALLGTWHGWGQPPLRARSEIAADGAASAGKTTGDLSGAGEADSLAPCPFEAPIRLYREFLVGAEEEPSALPPSPFLVHKARAVAPSERDDNRAELEALSALARHDGYELRFLIALVPDPIDSRLAARFDETLGAIQRAAAASGYLRDRSWLPWTGKAAEGHLYRKVPGALLFRSRESARARSLLMVLLVGETPRQGIHKQAFHEAAALADALIPGPHGHRVGVLGPTFSGSAESLHIALLNWRREEVERAYRGDSIGRGSLQFRIVTGSATAPGLKRFFTDLSGVQFDRTVLTDEVVATQGLRFLQNHLGWNREKIALVAESDSEYGRSLDLIDARIRPAIVVRLPGGLAGLRNAWEEAGAPRAADSSTALSSPRLTLDLSLADRSSPVDVAPELSPVSIRAHELAIANLLTALSREGFRYVGTLFTDSRDTLFLTRRIREFCPDSIIFTMGNDLLYAHPEYGPDMDGLVVLGNFPLIPEGALGSSLIAQPNPRSLRRQFTSESEEGIFQAARILIRSQGLPPQPNVWIGAVGNGSVWPLASIEGTSAQLTGRTLRPLAFFDLARQGNLVLLIALALLALLGRSLYQTALPSSSSAEASGRPRGRRLLILGLVILVLGAEIISWLATLELWNDEGACWRYLLAAGICLSIALIWGKVRGKQNLITVIVLLIATSFFLISLLAQRFWMPGGAAYFYFRARKFSSGLSPLVSLAWIGAALLTLTRCEIKRQRLIVLQGFKWPLSSLSGPTYDSCRDLAGRLERSLRVAVPFPVLWSIVPLLLFFTWIFNRVQPVAETRSYGCVFVTLVAWVLLWGTSSFYRFLEAWRSLVRILHRIEHGPMALAFQRVSTSVNWSPMKSFDWRMPAVQMPILSVERLQSIAGLLSPGPAIGHLNQALGKVLDLDASFDHSEPRRRPTQEEIQARDDVKEAFGTIYAELSSRAEDPNVLEFFALGTVAYVRYVFAHMSNCLTSGIAAALLALGAVRSYAFEPKRLVSAVVFTAILAEVATSVWTFFQMERNASLSAISHTTAGEVKVDRHLLSNLLTYGVIPVAGIVVTQFPSVGQYLVGWINPLLHVVGSG